MNKQEKHTNKPRLIDTDNSMVVTRGKGVGVVKGEGVKYRVTKDDLTSGGRHTMQYTDDVLQTWTPEPYIILLMNVTSKI